MFASLDTIRVKRSKKWRRFEHYALVDPLEIIFVQLVKTSSFDDRREGQWKEQINISTLCVMSSLNRGHFATKVNLLNRPAKCLNN